LKDKVNGINEKAIEKINEIELDFLKICNKTLNKEPMLPLAKNLQRKSIGLDGTGAARTRDLSLRRRSLYPSELQPQIHS
jgi:hypothetical protein